MKLHVKRLSFSTDNSRTPKLSNFTVFLLTIKTSSQNISMTLSQIPLKLHEHRSGSWRKKLRRTILEEQLPVSRKTAASKIGDGVISLLRQLWCHCNPDQIFIFVLLFQSCKLEYFKVAWYSFSGSIPPKFEHKLSRHKQRFVKNCHHNCMRQRLNELNPFARSKAVLVVWCKAFRYWDNQICSCIFCLHQIHKLQ